VEYVTGVGVISGFVSADELLYILDDIPLPWDFEPPPR
jgi:hypothetical protein